MAVISAPILLMLDPRFVPGSLMVAATVLTTLLLWRNRHAVVWREVAIASVGRMVTTVPTAILVSRVNEQAFSILFACSILLVVGLSFAGLKLRLNDTNLFLASCVSGVSNTISAVGGPPMALVYQSQQGDQLRGTLSAIFAIGASLAMVSLAAVDEFGLRDIALGLVLLPGIWLGFTISRYTAPRLDRTALRPAVLGVAGLSSLVVLFRALFAGD